MIAVAQHHHHQCPPDRTANPSGLPGTRDHPVGSIVALSFDLTITELSMIERLEAAQLATRSTFVRDVIARAMSADARDEASAYHSFFVDRNARIEAVDITEESRSRFYGEMRDDGSDNVGVKNTSARRFLCPPKERVLVDAVYTYVNPESASHRSAATAACKQGHKSGCSDQRFRDFNELLHSLRTVHYRGQHGEGHHFDGNDYESTGQVVGDVYVVVADRDQIPKWLHHVPIEIGGANTSSFTEGASSVRDDDDAIVFSVTHEEIFPLHLRRISLPTFNSFAIEANLHRIPGLRRFFVYFNNDMFWGRKVSFFDYFRPLSHVRQEFHVRTTPEGECLAQQVEDHVQRHAGSEKRDATRSRRAVVFMETVHYFETEDLSSSQRQLVVKRQSRTKRSTHLAAARRAQAVAANNVTTRLNESSSRDSRHSSCAAHPLKASSFWRLRTPENDGEQGLTLSANRRLLFEQYGLPPSHTFAHYPGIYDRSVLSRMLDDELREFAEATSKSRFRAVKNLWVTMVYPWIAFAHRRAVDRSLVIDELRLWKEPLRSENGFFVVDGNTKTTRRLDGAASRTKLTQEMNRLGPRMDLDFGELPKLYQGDMWLSPSACTFAMLPCLFSVDQSSPSFLSAHFVRQKVVTLPDIAHAKLRSWTVTVDDGKVGNPIYLFCMMSFTSFPGCFMDLWLGTKLFVTANDDLAFLDPLSATAVKIFLSAVSRGSHSAPWERM